MSFRVRLIYWLCILERTLGECYGVTNSNLRGVDKGEIDEIGSLLPEPVDSTLFLLLDNGDSGSCFMYLGTVLLLGLLNMVNFSRSLSTICLREKSNDTQNTIESYLV